MIDIDAIEAETAPPCEGPPPHGEAVGCCGHCSARALISEVKTLTAERDELVVVLKKMVSTETWAGAFCPKCKSSIGRSTELIKMARQTIEKVERLKKCHQP